MSETRPPPEEQERLYRALAQAVFRSVDEPWREILLQITPDGSNGVQLEIFGPDGAANLRMPDDSMYEPALALYDLFAKESRPFARCDFRLRWDDGKESWRFTAEYEYPPEA
jgi:hypothetical protein